jgi:aspartate oxidase
MMTLEDMEKYKKWLDEAALTQEEIDAKIKTITENLQRAGILDKDGEVIPIHITPHY